MTGVSTIEQSIRCKEILQDHTTESVRRAAGYLGTTRCGTAEGVPLQVDIVDKNIDLKSPHQFAKSQGKATGKATGKDTGSTRCSTSF
jgi:hypothetical protein